MLGKQGNFGQGRIFITFMDFFQNIYPWYSPERDCHSRSNCFESDCYNIGNQRLMQLRCIVQIGGGQGSNPGAQGDETGLYCAIQIYWCGLWRTSIQLQWFQTAFCYVEKGPNLDGTLGLGLQAGCFGGISKYIMMK